MITDAVSHSLVPEPSVTLLVTTFTIRKPLVAPTACGLKLNPLRGRENPAARAKVRAKALGGTGRARGSGDLAARTLLAAPSSASSSRGPDLPGSPASGSPASPDPGCCPGPIPGQSRRDPGQAPSFLLGDPFAEGALSLRAMFLLTRSGCLRLPGSFNKR
uniref:Uncharacterized protein n=1 Tax=Rangifer tarandus platyrhynchus TaxID=3082113 RepID=A0ACB0FAA4_RANTA|nr:unnamed protein product [Rangifer tarandus platyrhynchus]